MYFSEFLCQGTGWIGEKVGMQFQIDDRCEDLHQEVMDRPSFLERNPMGFGVSWYQ
jgi:hypothetical protein